MDKQEIQKLPNNIGGDSKSFVAKLKKVLQGLSESLSDVTDRVEGVEPDEVAQLIGLKVTEEHTTDSNGMPQNNIVVEYDNTNVSDFASANIWLSSDNGANYQRAGSSNNLRYIIENVKAGTTYVVKVTAVNKKGNESDFDKAPTAVITIKGSVLVPDAPYQFYLTWGPDGPLWEWLYNDNGYIDFFELRLDANAGEYNENLLDRTRNSYSTANPGVRSGTAYLFVRNIFGTYSLPATHIFNKPIGQKPNPATIIKLLYGVNIKMDPLPEGYTGYKLVINGDDEYTTDNNEFTFYQVSGTLTVKYCFVDAVGDGEYSDVVTVQIKTVFDDVEIPEVHYEMFDSAIQSAIDKANAQADINETLASAIEQTSESITAVVTELNKPPDEVSYSAITMLKDGIDLSVKQDDVINRINLSTEGITIDGSKLHITGDTVIDGKVIVGANIADGAISDEELADGAVTSGKLSAGSVGSVAIADGAVVADHIASNSITSAHITANAITSDKINAGAITADKIDADAVTADKIAAEAVTAEAIQAGSIIGQHISAGAITTEKLAADTITLSGALQIVGGAVTLSGNGLKVSETNGEYTIFDSDGITFFDNGGNPYAMVKKQLIGTASDGQRITFNNPWPSPPKVICTPLDLTSYVANYEGFNTIVQCFAYDISQTGFNVRCRTIIAAGTTGGELALNKELDGDAPDAVKFSDDGYYGEEYTIPWRPPSETSITISGSMYLYGSNGPFWAGDGSKLSGHVCAKAYVKLFVNGNLAKQSQTITSNRSPVTTSLSVTADNVPANAILKVRLCAWYWDYYVDGYTQHHLMNGNAKANAVYTISSMSASINIESVANTGTASFIATDGSGTGYTVS